MGRAGPRTLLESIRGLYRVVMFDRRGAGLSDRSAGAERLGLPALAMDVKAVLDSTDTQRAVLLGVTLGCPIAVPFAASYPDRVQALVLAGEDHTLFLGDQRATGRAVVGFLDGTVADGALRSALRRADRKNAAGTGWDSLTPSEQEVARLIASGMTNGQVAARLSMSPHTVDGRMRRVFAKLGVNTRVELTAEYTRVTG